jgi:hypothetical protein
VVGETTFSWGQLEGVVITGSNIGGIYVFDGKEWRMLLEPKLGTSYQIYSMLNYYDRMLMGQYPTGEIFEFDGENVKHIEGWPPRLEGVSGSAREAQTSVIYGGDLYVGVWPWGEVWRYNPDSKTWTFAARMFTHPPLTKETNHPYEKECVALGIVSNQWGQRVTGLLPIADALMVSTSAKWPCKWEPRFTFVDGDRWRDYGAVYRLHASGSLSAPVRWTDGPTALEFSIDGSGRMAIAQDGSLLASSGPDAGLKTLVDEAGVVMRPEWGSGMFGTFAGAAIDGTLE